MFIVLMEKRNFMAASADITLKKIPRTTTLNIKKRLFFSMFSSVFFNRLYYYILSCFFQGENPVNNCMFDINPVQNKLLPTQKQLFYWVLHFTFTFLNSGLRIQVVSGSCRGNSRIARI